MSLIVETHTFQGFIPREQRQKDIRIRSSSIQRMRREYLPSAPTRKSLHVADSPTLLQKRHVSTCTRSRISSRHRLQASNTRSPNTNTTPSWSITNSSPSPTTCAYTCRNPQQSITNYPLWILSCVYTCRSLSPRTHCESSFLCLHLQDLHRLGQTDI